MYIDLWDNNPVNREAYVMIRYINQDANVITRIHDDCCIDMIEPSMRRMSSIVSDYYKRENMEIINRMSTKLPQTTKNP